MTDPERTAIATAVALLRASRDAFRSRQVAQARALLEPLLAKGATLHVPVCPEHERPLFCPACIGQRGGRRQSDAQRLAARDALRLGPEARRRKVPVLGP